MAIGGEGLAKRRARAAAGRIDVTAAAGQAGFRGIFGQRVRRAGRQPQCAADQQEAHGDACLLLTRCAGATAPAA